MRDRTNEQWFGGKKDFNTTITPQNRRNILASLLVVSETKQTIRAKFLNNGKPSILHYIGNSHWVNKTTGYVHDWDGAHVCDRCGSRLETTFSSNSLEAAIFKDENPRVALLGLCPKCESALERQRNKDIMDGLIRREKGGLLLEPRPRRSNDFEDWLYLDSRRAPEQRRRISDRV